MNDDWTDRLLCPTCGSSDTGVLQPERELPTLLNGLPGRPWREPGLACCRTCGAEFEFVSQEASDDTANG
jgi:hypothetical protein